MWHEAPSEVYVPGLHPVQAVSPLRLYVPAEHVLHRLCLVWLVNVPGLHVLHVAMPAVE